MKRPKKAAARKPRAKPWAAKGRISGLALQQLVKKQAAALERQAAKIEALEKNLTEALGQQTATAEILGAISQTQTDVQSVFEAITRSALKLCDATSSIVTTFDGESIHLSALANVNPQGAEALRRRFPMRPGRASGAARAILTRSIVQIPDTREDQELLLQDAAEAAQYRSVLVVPMLREGEPIGTVNVHKAEPGPFTDGQIALLKTFADQAVIAIENVRLFTELNEALEQQTATSEVLDVISRSALDVTPVFQAIVDKAVGLCGADNASILRRDGEVYRYVANAGDFVDEKTFMSYWGPVALSAGRGSLSGRVALERRSVQIDDIDTDPEYEPEYLAQKVPGTRTHLAVPLLKDGEPVGLIIARRFAVRRFTEKQIKLLETFAVQAVIAIENVRLFAELETRNRELTESLEQQTATAEILRAISRSPTDLQPVFDTIVRNAGRVCDAVDALLVLREGDDVRAAAHWGPIRTLATGARYPLSQGTAMGRAILEARPVHVEDIATAADFPEGRELATQYGHRTALAVPLLRREEPVGSLLIRRTEVRPFSDKQISMVKTFADQAVIAIENVRLFTELQQRTRQLTRSVDELTALGEVSRAVSSTLDLETVLTTIVARANDLCGTDGAGIYEFDATASEFHLRATKNFSKELVDVSRTAPLRRGEGIMGRLAETREPIQIPDITAEGAYQSPVRGILIRDGYRALLSVPLLRDDDVIGALTVGRKVAGEFAFEVVDLLRTFAAQSSLAIQNARLFHELEIKSRELEIASQHKSEFLASMSHELRTPLNSIIGFSDVLLQGIFGETNEKQTEYLQDILASGQHLLSLINDILDLSKIEAGRMELDLGDFDLPTAIDNAMILMRERAGRRGLTLERQIDERLGEIRADERKVKQVLLNLLSNAVKFTPEGGRIDVKAKLTDGMVEISVTDTGIGIAPEDHEAVFEEFRQVGKADKKAEGTGLGLALCRKFVELHGGRIWVKSQVWQGSTFTFTLPGRHGR